MINPSDKPCWETCKACFRCANKGTMRKCDSCSGRHDPLLRRDPYDIDDACVCATGVLRMRLKRGKLAIAKYPNDPFGGVTKTDRETEDERDWNAYVDSQREVRGDEDFDPLQFGSGGSVTDWMRNSRKGIR